MEKDLNGNERRKLLLSLIQQTDIPLSGKALGEKTGVSRQIVVQDIALLRTQGYSIISTPKGYLCAPSTTKCSRRFKVHHTNDQLEEELQLIVDLGGMVNDVLINHRVYGQVSAPLYIKSRRDIKNFVEDVTCGKSTPLCNITSGYHFHTIIADSEEILDEIEEALKKNHFLAEVLPYEREMFLS